MPPPIAIVACQVLEAEVRYLATLHPHLRVEIVRQELHNTPKDLQKELTRILAELDQDPQIEAVVLGYGLCSRGVEGLGLNNKPLVIPRAHDCITLFLGSRERYDAQMAACPGTYWYTPGWENHGWTPSAEEHAKYLAEYIEKYGEDNGRFLFETMFSWTGHYERAAYVDCIPNPDPSALERVQAAAAERGWKFERLSGDITLLERLITASWDQDFLVVPPGQHIVYDSGSRVMRAVPG